MIPEGGDVAKEHIFWTREFSDVYLMSTSENSIYCLSYPVLSYHFRHHPSTIHSASHRRTVTNLPNVKNAPFGHLSMTNLEKKNYQPLSLVHLKGGCSSQAWELNEPNCKQFLPPDHIKIPPLRWANFWIGPGLNQRFLEGIDWWLTPICCRISWNRSKKKWVVKWVCLNIGYPKIHVRLSYFSLSKLLSHTRYPIFRHSHHILLVVQYIHVHIDRWIDR